MLLQADERAHEVSAWWSSVVPLAGTTGLLKRTGPTTKKGSGLLAF